jgi:hypothetical protein
MRFGRGRVESTTRKYAEAIGLLDEQVALPSLGFGGPDADWSNRNPSPYTA